jgi:hypothetical protein
MIDYLGISTREIFCEGLPRAQFEVCFLNTTKNGLFTIRTTASPRSLENPKFEADEYITSKTRFFLKRYCEVNKEDITHADLNALCEKIRPDVEKCIKAWLDGNKNFIIKEIDK